MKRVNVADVDGSVTSRDGDGDARRENATVTCGGDSATSVDVESAKRETNGRESRMLLDDSLGARVRRALVLWFVCARRVMPQILLAGLTGAGAQWLKRRACDDSQRYSSECAYALPIDAHAAVGVILSFLLVFRVVQAFRRYEDAKQALIDIKCSMRSCFALADVELADAGSKSNSVDSSRAHRLAEIRRFMDASYALMRQAVRDSRHGVRDIDAASGKVDTDTEALLADEYSKPSLSAVTSIEERRVLARFKAQSRPAVAMSFMLNQVQRALQDGTLSEKATLEVFKYSQKALDSYRETLTLVETWAPREYTHSVTVLLFAFVFSIPFALTQVTDWRTPLVSATVAWLFYGVNEISVALEDPFTWALPSHPLRAIGARIHQEMQAFNMKDGVFDDEIDGEKTDYEEIDTQSYKSKRKVSWFITDCFAWRDTVLPYIYKQLLCAACVGAGAQFLKVAVCGHGITKSSECLVTFDISAHAVLAIPLSFLLVINTDWGYDRYISAKRLITSLQNDMRSLVTISSMFVASDDATKNNSESSEVRRFTDILFSLNRILVRELMIRDPHGKTIDLEDCLKTDAYGCGRKLCNLLTKEEMDEVRSMPMHSLTTWAAVRINNIFNRNLQSGHVSERFASDAYRRVCSALQNVQGLLRIISTPVPKHFRHLLQLTLLFYVFTMPFVLSVRYRWLTAIPSTLVALAFYGVAETSTGMMEPFGWNGPRHELGELGTRMGLFHERLHALSSHLTGGSDVWNTLEDELHVLETVMLSHTKLMGLGSSSLNFDTLSRAPSIHLKNISKRERAFKKFARTSGMALRSGWSFVTCVFHFKGTVLHDILFQILFSGLVALVANFMKVHYCGDNVKEVQSCSVTFDSNGHIMTGALIGFTIVFRLSISYKRYYDGKGAVGRIVNNVRCLNLGMNTMIQRCSGGNKTELSLLSDVQEIRRLSCVLVGFIRQTIRECRHGIEPYAKAFRQPTTDELLDDPHGWPSLSILLTDEEKVKYAKCSYHARIGICSAKITRIIERRRKQKLVSDRNALDMIYCVHSCIDASTDIERILASGMPQPFVHLIDIALFWFTISVPFVFSVNYKWLAPLPAMLVSTALYGIVQLGSILEDPFGWEDPKHDLTKVSWSIYTESFAIHESSFRTLGRDEKGIRSGIDSLILSGAGAPKALRQPTTLEAIRRRRGGERSDSSSYIMRLLKVRGTVFPFVWPVMMIVMLIGIGAQFVKIKICGDGVTDHTQCDLIFAPSAVSIIGRIFTFVIVYRFFFAFQLFYEAKTGIYDIFHNLFLLNVQACSFLDDDPTGNKRDRGQIDVKAEILRGTSRLIDTMNRVLYERADDCTLTVYERLLDQPILKIATDLVSLIEGARLGGHLGNRHASIMVDAVNKALRAHSSCKRAQIASVPYGVKHMLNLVVLVWLISAASVLVATFKYMTWLPLGVLAIILYGLLAIARFMEKPFRAQSCEIDLHAIRKSLVESCLDTHVHSSARVDAAGSLEKCVDGTQARAESKPLTDESAAMADVPSAWTFPTQRRFRGAKWGLFLEWFAFRQTLVIPLLPHVLLACGWSVGVYFIAHSVCTESELYETLQCRILIGDEAHVVSTPIFGFCIAYILSAGFARYYSARKSLDDLFDNARHLTMELRVLFPEGVDKVKRDYSTELLHELDSLVALIRQSIREARIGFPKALDVHSSCSLSESALEDDFVGTPSTKDFMMPAERNEYAGCSANMRVIKCFARLQRSISMLRQFDDVYEQRRYRLHRTVAAIVDAWSECEAVLTTPVPPYYVSSILIICVVFVATAPLAWISSYGKAVVIPIAILTFLVYGVLYEAQQLMNPFSWAPTSHDLSALGLRVSRLSQTPKKIHH